MEQGDSTQGAALDSGIWHGVAELVDRAPGLSDLRNHRIELLAAQRWRELGRPVPPELLAAERWAALVVLTAPVLLQRARSAYGGTMLVLKGPEIAAHYPDPALRPFKDLDLLVDDAEAAQQALLGAGFRPVGDPSLYLDIHHLRPLAFPGLPITVELHSRVKWIDGLAPPAAAELFSLATDGAVGVESVLALPPQHHALLLAAHSWAHEPLRRLRDVIDVAAMAAGIDRDLLRALARTWGIEKVWTTTIAAADAVLVGGPMPWALRLWGQNLRKVRERTVLENHVQRWLGDFWVLPADQAIRALPPKLAREVRPENAEGWRSKLVRTRHALRDAFRPKSEHDERLDRSSRSGGVEGSDQGGGS
jgi:hypothetical protein